MSAGGKARIGMCGLGSFSVVLSNTIRRSERIELVTCYDPVPERRDAACARYGCAQEKRYEDMVRRDDLDGVVIVSPNAFHREQAELAARHGKHVYGTEANLVRTVARVDRRYDAERTQGPDESTRLELYRKGRTEPEAVALKIGDPLLEEIDEFAQCITTGRKPETDGRSSLAALALIRAAIESARTGRPADVDNSG